MVEELRSYVGSFIPTNWQEPISKVGTVPYWSDEDFENIKNGVYPLNASWAYMKEACISFFKEQEKCMKN